MIASVRTRYERFCVRERFLSYRSTEDKKELRGMRTMYPSAGATCRIRNSVNFVMVIMYPKSIFHPTISIVHICKLFIDEEHDRSREEG